MAVNTDRWLGAAGAGIVNGVLNESQLDSGNAGVLESFGVPSNAIAFNLVGIAIDAFAPHIIPANYRDTAEGAVDYAVGATVQYLASRSGLGSMTYPGAGSGGAVTGRRLFGRSIRRAGASHAPRIAAARPAAPAAPAGFVSGDL